MSRFVHLALGFLCMRVFPLVCVKDNTSPAHCPLRYPIIDTRFRDWGTPKFLLLSTCQHTSYPSSVQAVLTRFQPQAVKNSHAMLHLLSPKSLMLFGDPVFNVLRIVSNVLPESWLSNPGTFSRKRYLGFLTATILAISKKQRSSCIVESFSCSCD